jgi:hypothetical protein
VTCQICGLTATAADGDPPVTWVLDVAGDRRGWTCPGCARDNVRSIEAQLEPDWW